MLTLIKKLLFIAIPLATIGAYAIYLTTGKNPLATFKQALPEISIQENLNSLSEKVTLPNSSDIGEKQTVFKWTDKNGVIQYTSEAPPEGTIVSTLELDPNTNIVQSIQIPTREEPTPPAQEDTPNANFIPANTEKLIDEAKNVQKLLNERTEQQQQIIDNL
ncbi:hypothetical protein TDB9533_01518 [Thalassocella blandensis]|nr:hypothetical protein TDB9533_01518 [Thalassocella blandensis]